MKAGQNNNIGSQRTLPSMFYKDPSLLEEMKEMIFARSWQLVTDIDRLKAPGQVVPHSVLEGCLSEPIIMTRDSDDQIHCLSNVCTHRGNLLVEGECHAQTLRCRYHGRRFSLDGQMISAPGFEGVEDFPNEADQLQSVPFGSWRKFLFAATTTDTPLFSLSDLTAQMSERLDFLPIEEYTFSQSRSRDYLVRANWALYVDNYLEGFHIPYVHPDLAVALDTKQYENELAEYSNLQVGYASVSGEGFDIPESSPDHGKNIAAYYFFLFPNMMFNFYPWGLSINIVTPLAVDRTKVSFLTYVFDESKISTGAGAALDKVEREDEDIVERVQRGMASRFYDSGRYSPQHEEGVHHFHSLLREFLGLD